jgi:hypothetical protein
LTSEDFQTLVLEYYRRTHRDNDTAARLTCSPPVITEFMRRNHFSLRRQHVKRRTPVRIVRMDE